MFYVWHVLLYLFLVWSHISKTINKLRCISPNFLVINFMVIYIYIVATHQYSLLAGYQPCGLAYRERGYVDKSA